MNWPKIKTILIWMFLAVDIFLLVWHANIRKESKEVSEETIENVVQLLSSRGIEIDESLISPEIVKADSVLAKSVLASEAEFLGKVLGKGYEKKDNLFYTEDKTLSIDNNSFVIAKRGNISSEDDAKAFALDNGFDLKNVEIAYSEGACTFMTYHNGKPLYDSSFTITESEGYIFLKGSFYYVIKKGDETPTIHITSILPKLLGEDIASGKIKAINLGYKNALDTGEKYSEITANPFYEIVLSDGRKYYYNASK